MTDEETKRTPVRAGHAQRQLAAAEQEMKRLREELLKVTVTRRQLVAAEQKIEHLREELIKADETQRQLVADEREMKRLREELLKAEERRDRWVRVVGKEALR